MLLFRLQGMFGVSFYVVICGEDHRVFDCTCSHKWYYDAISGRWVSPKGTSFDTLEEAEGVAFQIAYKKNEIGQVAVVSENS